MTVYFTASIVGKKLYETNYRRIVDALTSAGHRVSADHILKSSLKKITMERKNERIAFQKKLEGWITSCDCMVVEGTFPSISVGYEISLALSQRKPVLLLYCDGSPPSLLAHHSDENLVCEKYTLTSLQDVLDEFMSFAEGAQDSRFTFFISSEIAAYLEKITKETDMPKSVYLRHLIEKDMKTQN